VSVLLSVVGVEGIGGAREVTAARLNDRLRYISSLIVVCWCLYLWSYRLYCYRRFKGVNGLY
jgi:cobalamin synthase